MMFSNRKKISERSGKLLRKGVVEMTDKKEWLRRRNEDAKQAHAALMKFYPLDLEDLDG